MQLREHGIIRGNASRPAANLIRFLIRYLAGAEAGQQGSNAKDIPDVGSEISLC